MTLGIDIQGLTVRYGDVTAIDNLSLHLDGGKIYGLLGRNGSGKTTLLSVLAAYRKAAAGQVRVGTADPFENAVLTEQICLIRESGDLVDGESVKRTLARAATFRPAWDAELADRLLDTFQLSLRRGVATLSHGQRSALGIAIGLASRAPLTLLDESYLGLDAPSRYAFYDVLLADYMEHPRTFVISTHLIEGVADLFEEVVIIDHGRLITHGETESLRLRGTAVTGPARAVERYTNGQTVLSEQRLGGTTSAAVFGPVTDDMRRRASNEGLELGPISLQDLFVHLTARRPM